MTGTTVSTPGDADDVDGLLPGKIKKIKQIYFFCLFNSLTTLNIELLIKTKSLLVCA